MGLDFWGVHSEPRSSHLRQAKASSEARIQRTLRRLPVSRGAEDKEVVHLLFLRVESPLTFCATFRTTSDSLRFVSLHGRGNTF